MLSIKKSVKLSWCCVRQETDDTNNTFTDRKMWAIHKPHTENHIMNPFDSAAEQSTATVTTAMPTTNSSNNVLVGNFTSPLQQQQLNAYVVPPSSPVLTTANNNSNNNVVNNSATNLLSSASSPPPVYSRSNSSKSVAHRRTASREHQPIAAQQLTTTRIQRRPVGIHSLQKAVLATVFSYLDDDELEQKIALVSKDWVLLRFSIFSAIPWFRHMHDRASYSHAN